MSAITELDNGCLAILIDCPIAIHKPVLNASPVRKLVQTPLRGLQMLHRYVPALQVGSKDTSVASTAWQRHKPLMSSGCLNHIPVLELHTAQFLFTMTVPARISVHATQGQCSYCTSREITRLD